MPCRTRHADASLHRPGVLRAPYPGGRSCVRSLCLLDCLPANPGPVRPSMGALKRRWESIAILRRICLDRVNIEQPLPLGLTGPNLVLLRCNMHRSRAAPKALLPCVRRSNTVRQAKERSAAAELNAFQFRLVSPIFHRVVGAGIISVAGLALILQYGHRVSGPGFPVSPGNSLKTT